MSLLPACITDLEDYEFCFEMRPATEVGGDYYDYIVTGPGKISIVIGDATNHGMKAGMMVSIMKSLFLSHVNHTNISDFLNRCSRIIKQMQLKNLFMALMKVKIDGPELTISSAGIPPLLFYRKETDIIEEITVKGMPLGALESFPYETVETELSPGDTVLMMSDGILELFNGEKEMFGNDKVKEVFLENVNKPVAKIVDSLFLAADKWRGDAMQNDDITLVSFRLKPNGVVN
jgi:serine phosphatase RsbU (regulator of sigma subunit)